MSGKGSATAVMVMVTVKRLPLKLELTTGMTMSGTLVPTASTMMVKIDPVSHQPTLVTTISEASALTAATW